MKTPSITITHSTSTHNKQIINQSTSTVDYMKTASCSLNEHAHTTSESSVCDQHNKQNMELFLQQKDLALQPLDFIYELAVVQKNILLEIKSENSELYNEDLLSQGFNSSKDN